MMTLVIVHWIDTVGHGDNTWLTVGEVMEVKPSPMVTVGFLMKETNDYVVVAATKAEQVDDDIFGNVNAIPRSCITDMREVCSQNPCAQRTQ